MFLLVYIISYIYMCVYISYIYVYIYHIYIYAVDISKAFRTQKQFISPSDDTCSVTCYLLFLTEMRLIKLGLLVNVDQNHSRNRYFTSRYGHSSGGIEDDHIPFLRKSTSLL